MGAQAVVTVSGLPEKAGGSSTEENQVDAAGQAILNLLQKASNIAEANNQRAAEMAEKLYHQLRVAEDKIVSLQSEAQFYRGRFEQAEKWLHRIYDDIERQFIRPSQQKR